MNAIKAGLLALPLALLLSGCAEQRMRHQIDADDRIDVALEHAGPPASAFHLDASDASWEALGNTHLLVRDSAGATWLLQTEVCPGLPNTKRVTLTRSRDNFIYVGQDRLVREAASCQLIEARPVAGIEVHGVRGTLQTRPRPKQEDLAGSF